ncbi:CPBP family intramembrane glutamic endopeptidase [Pseudomonas sp. TE3610]
MDVKPALKIFLWVIVVICLVDTVAEVATGVGREPFMVTFLTGLSLPQTLLCLAMLAIFPPVSEELLFRHFLIRLFPLAHRNWRIVAVIFTAALFVASHTQYQHWTTFVTLAVIGVALAIARLKTGGVVVPIVMHCSAEVAGMVTDWMSAQWTS